MNMNSTKDLFVLTYPRKDVYHHAEIFYASNRPINFSKCIPRPAGGVSQRDKSSVVAGMNYFNPPLTITCDVSCSARK